MAQRCEPPLNVSMSTFMNAPNDNNNVNVFALGDDVELLSENDIIFEIAVGVGELKGKRYLPQCAPVFHRAERRPLQEAGPRAMSCPGWLLPVPWSTEE